MKWHFMKTDLRITLQADNGSPASTVLAAASNSTWLRLVRARAVISALALLVAAPLHPVQAADASGTVRYESQPGTVVTMDGTSNIHDWTVKGGIIKGFIESDSGFPESATKPGANSPPPKVEATIPVRTLKSTVSVGSKRMDEVMQEHLNMAKHPNIEYRLLALKPKEGASGGAVQFDATGALTVAGVTRTNTTPVTFTRTNNNQLRVTLTTTLKMGDYGVKPPSPSLAMGMIKTSEEVKISIDWLTGVKSESAP